MSPKVSDEHKEQRRLQILEAAERVFARKGYEPATMKDIVEEAAMSRGWIYLYYQTKEEIFVAMMEKLDQENAVRIRQLGDQTGSVWKLLELWMEEGKRELASLSETVIPAFYEFFLTGWRNERRQELLRLRYRRSIRELTALLQSGVDKGEFRPTLETGQIARIAASQIDGIHMHVLAVGAEESAAAVQIDALLAYLGTLLGVSRPASSSSH
ncbi:putative HTH-type transcriptional regulator YfiR [Paenibacillus sp. J31TS4]|uniref:TetR family transcriptional regulator n=1 Tax=Paenibacillus sp. J31TS4 TaxID=2807195 RepID=UPI001B0C448A|nr:TetR family transcriptional regulator [Paenibacillus sp. J31TS4]GIP40478.1 putative HTH-type transcriptional regulator YfiR [Paenibacillus sp. J31TS4]